ncbi:hypothetical protein MP638_000076 [Amoeboaphelidium occidentale]|nr:hypothetical protein MP638_000076 [Amoeboaphelidium occidentale]
MATSEEDKFYKAFKDYSYSRGISKSNIVLMSRNVDIYRMYRSVQDRGGYKAVCKTNDWKYVFLDSTGAPNYSSNTGYYTKIAYEKNLLDFEKAIAFQVSGEKPAPLVVTTSRRNSREYSSGDDDTIPTSVDWDDLKKVLAVKWDVGLDTLEKQKPESDKDKEEWYTKCEEKLNFMKKHYPELKKRLDIIDRVLGPDETSANQKYQAMLPVNSSSETEQPSNQGNSTADESATEAPSAINTEDESDGKKKMETETRTRKRNAAVVNATADTTENDDSDGLSDSSSSKKRRRRSRK